MIKSALDHVPPGGEMEKLGLGVSVDKTVPRGRFRAERPYAHRERRTSFLKKRSKKLLFGCRGLPTGARKKAKVFWFFFSKKNILSYFATWNTRSMRSQEKSRKSDFIRSCVRPRFT
jgi:hypothetical protein